MWDVGIPSILHHTLPLNGWVWDKQARPNFILISNDVRPHSHIRFNQCGILQFHQFYVTKYDKVDLPLVYLWSTKSMQAWIFALKSGSNCKEGATLQRPRVVTILKKLVHLQSVSNMVWKQSCAWKVKMRSCRQFQCSNPFEIKEKNYESRYWNLDGILPRTLYYNSTQLLYLFMPPHHVNGKIQDQCLDK